MDVEKVLSQVQDTLTVMANIQERQAAVLKGHSDWLETLQRGQELHEKRMADHDRATAEHDRRIAQLDERWSEVKDKLDALIAIADGMIRRHPPEPPASKE